MVPRCLACHGKACQRNARPTRRAGAGIDTSRASIVGELSGGGSDANVFFEKGIPLGILGTGMREVHSVREHVALEDMIRATELLLEIIRLQASA